MSAVFISYSHDDEQWLERVSKHLAVLEKQGKFSVWSDREIGGGEGWLERIQEAIERARVAILLVSANSLTSDFILREEMEKLLDRQQRDGVWVYPIIVSPCAWDEVEWLRRTQVRPRGATPLSSLREHEVDAALTAVAKEIHAILSRSSADEGELPGADRSSRTVNGAHATPGSISFTRWLADRLDQAALPAAAGQLLCAHGLAALTWWNNITTMTTWGVLPGSRYMQVFLWTGIGLGGIIAAASWRHRFHPGVIHGAAAATASVWLYRFVRRLLAGSWASFLNSFALPVFIALMVFTLSALMTAGGLRQALGRSSERGWTTRTAERLSNGLAVLVILPALVVLPFVFLSHPSDEYWSPALAWPIYLLAVPLGTVSLRGGHWSGLVFAFSLPVLTLFADLLEGRVAAALVIGIPTCAVLAAVTLGRRKTKRPGRNEAERRS